MTYLMKTFEFDGINDINNKEIMLLKVTKIFFDKNRKYDQMRSRCCRIVAVLML